MNQYDLLIKNATVVDPSQALDHVTRDVAFVEGKVAALEDSIPRRLARDVLDASDLLVTPGLIDLHVHAFWGGSYYGINADHGNINKGVTTAVDAGSSGAATFRMFNQHVIQQSATRILALLNVSMMGMAIGYGGLEDTRWADVDELVQVGRLNRDVVVGVKARIPPMDSTRHDYVLRKAIKSAEILDIPLMLHLGGSSLSVDQRLDYLRAGDVLTHAFRSNNSNNGIVDENLVLRDSAREARSRGVYFDVGHGSGSFSFETASSLLEQGFLPDTISTDLHKSTIAGPVFDLPTTLSKFMCLGLSRYEVIERATSQPARVLGKSNHLGTLRIGAAGDATIMKCAEGSFSFFDSKGIEIIGSHLLEHIATIRNGILYKPHLLPTI